MNQTSAGEFAALIGIDWADRKHDVCLLAQDSNTPEFSVLTHRPECISQWAERLRERFAGKPIAVCLEVAKGPLVYALQRYPFFVLFPVNPSTLAQYRKTFHVSGAKDDPGDAQLALDLLVTHSREAHQAAAAKCRHANARAARRATPSIGRRCYPTD